MKRHQTKKFRKSTLQNICATGVSLCVAASLAPAHAASVEELTKENQDLKARMDALEALAQKEGLLPSGKPAPKFVSTMSDISLSGFVTASYFYDTSSPDDNSSNAYLWNRNSGDFTLNKVKLVLASKPVEYSGEEWDAAFRVSLIWGEDAPIVNTGGELQGFEDLREAYVELNAPLGTGLNIRAGQLISLLNWESGDGGAANPNFSQGNQWFYTGNGPSAGVQLGYNLTETINLKVRVQNGLYAGPTDNFDTKTIMASLGFKPNDQLWFNVIGFGGSEEFSTPGTDDVDIFGGSVIGGYQFSEKFGSGFEFDYFHLDPSIGETDEFWSAGVWLWYDFSPKTGVALRAEYLDDETGLGTSGLLGFPANDGADIYGITATFNYKPVPNVKIQPEIRYDATSEDDGFDGEDSRFIVGCGISYLF